LKKIQKNNLPSSTIFDDVYRTMIQKIPATIIPAINEAYNTHYDENTQLQQLRNEYLEIGGKIITDSLICIGDSLYHLECQSWPDGTMAIRMFEYDIAIALEGARKQKDYSHIKFPQSGVIYLRHNNATPDVLSLTVEFSDGQEVVYNVPVIKVKEYSLEDIFHKHLWLFIPYYIMRYEDQFDTMEIDTAQRSAMLADLQEMVATFESYAKNTKQTDIYTDIMQLAKRISEYMLRDKKITKKEVNRIMGGKILELHSEKMLKKGRKEGEKKGRASGRLEMLTELVISNIKKNKPLAEIADSFNISIDEVIQIGKKHGITIAH